jgi:mannose-1-phosphate guanylyltransferase
VVVENANLFGLILAGGSGTRLWPRSREARPKQFIDLLGPSTMLQDAHARLLPIIPAERIVVATSREHVGTVREQLPDVPAENVLAEPEGRGTAAAIGFGAVAIRQRDANATMVVVTADHRILKTDDFRAVVLAAAEVASEGWLVTLGIQPSYPETGYGYVERGEPLKAAAVREVYRVNRFVEKPDRATAEDYVRRGTFSWNSGMFVWRVDRILGELQRHMPALRAGLDEIGAALPNPSAGDVLRSVWPHLPKETIDFGIMEKADRVAVLPADIGWSDVGSWSAVYELSPRDNAGNVALGKVLPLDTRGSLIYSPHRLIATVGVDDLVVVDAGDVLLICPRARAQDVKRIVSELQARGEEHYL